MRFQSAPDCSGKPEVFWQVGGRTCNEKREDTLEDAESSRPN